MPTHLPFTEKPVPETVTNGDDDPPPSLGDVRAGRAKTGERREKSQRARAASMGEGYMPVPVGDQAGGAKVDPIFLPLVGRGWSRVRRSTGREPAAGHGNRRSHERMTALDKIVRGFFQSQVDRFVRASMSSGKSETRIT